MKTRFDYFDQFVLNEAKKNKDQDVKVILLSNISEESYTVPAMEKECKKRNIPFKVIDINTCSLNLEEDGENYIISDKKTKPYKINSENTVILTRRGVVRNTFTRDIVSQLESANFFVVNSLESILACENKYVTSKILMDSGIPVPKMAMVEGEESIEPAVEKIGGKFPVVLKMLSGSQGIGVSIIESLASLKSVLQTLWKVDPNVETLIQEKIETEYDLRIHVLTKKFNSPTPQDDDSVILGVMRRNKVDKDFRTNYSLGGTVEKFDITPEQEKIAKESAKAIGCSWCGVDIIVDEKTKKNYVLEVNSSPGTQGLKKATGIDVVKDVIDFVCDKENWIRSKRAIGFREVVTIPGIGDFVAKFDTGDGALSCSLTYDKMKVDEDKKIVNWELGGKKFKSKLVGISNAEVGDKTYERPVIEMDVSFCNKLYKGVAVSLVDRKDKSTKFLCNRNFMKRLGCSVSPSKTFVVTTFSGEYSPKDSKGDQHAGIKFEK